MPFPRGGSGSGITQLTGDVTAGPGSGSVADTLVATANVISVIRANQTASAVSSVFSRTGAVVAGTNDYSVAQVLGAAPLASPALTGTPTAPTQATNDNTTAIATDAFVQTAVANAVAGVNPAIAVLVATVSSADTSGLTYANGASGIGATLTGTINTPVTIDGQLLNTLGQRLLVKNDTQAPSGAFNGHARSLSSPVPAPPRCSRVHSTTTRRAT